MISPNTLVPPHPTPPLLEVLLNSASYLAPALGYWSLFQERRIFICLPRVFLVDFSDKITLDSPVYLQLFDPIPASGAANFGGWKWNRVRYRPPSNLYPFLFLLTF